MDNVDVYLDKLINKIWEDNIIDDNEEDSLKDHYNSFSKENNLNLLDFESICRKTKYNIFINRIKNIDNIKITKNKNNNDVILLNNILIYEIEFSLNRYYFYFTVDNSILNNDNFSLLIDNYKKDNFNARIDLDNIKDMNIALELFRIVCKNNANNSNIEENIKKYDPETRYKQLIYNIWEDNKLDPEEITMLRLAPKELGLDSKKAFLIYIRAVYSIIVNKIKNLNKNIKITKDYNNSEKKGIITFSFYDKSFFIINISVYELEFLQKLPFNIDNSKVINTAVKLKETGPFVWYKINALKIKNIDKIIEPTSFTIEMFGSY